MGAIANDWLEPLKPEFSKPYYAKLYKTVVHEYSTHVVYPPSDEIFSAFEFTPLSKVKAVILGQDPYHEPGQANGLCFSVKPGVEIPPSLVNIYQGRHAAQYRSHGPRASGQFAQGYRLDGIYRCGDQDPERTGPADCFHALGPVGTEQRSHADQSEAYDYQVGASESAFCLPRIFRQPSFQPGK